MADTEEQDTKVRNVVEFYIRKIREMSRQALIVFIVEALMGVTASTIKTHVENYKPAAPFVFMKEAKNVLSHMEKKVGVPITPAVKTSYIDEMKRTIEFDKLRFWSNRWRYDPSRDIETVTKLFRSQFKSFACLRTKAGNIQYSGKASGQNDDILMAAMQCRYWMVIFVLQKDTKYKQADKYLVDMI